MLLNTFMAMYLWKCMAGLKPGLLWRRSPGGLQVAPPPQHHRVPNITQTLSWQNISISVHQLLFQLALFNDFAHIPWEGTPNLPKTPQRKKFLHKLVVERPGYHPGVYGWYLKIVGYCTNTSNTAQGGGGSFKNRKSIGEIACCESWMSEQKHWPTTN